MEAIHLEVHSLPDGEQRSKIITAVGSVLGALQLEIEEDLFQQFPELQSQFRKLTN